MAFLPGLLLCLILALPAHFLGKAFPLMGGPVFGILFGLLLGLIVPNLASRKIGASPLSKGTTFTAKKILQLSIILLGFEMNIQKIISVGSTSILVMLFTLTTSFVVAYFVGRALHIDRSIKILVGVGTSICGGSAIAATAPVIDADESDVAHSISTIFLFNILAVFIFPALGHLLGLGDQGFGLWAGTAINDTSSVVAAASSWSQQAGNDLALELATIVKLTRTLMIVPITLVLGIVESRRHRGHANYQFSKVFPWFVLGFLGAAILASLGLVSPDVASFLGKFGKFCIVLAMCAIGLNTNLKSLIKNGRDPILLGLACWVSIACVSLLVQHVLHLW